MVRTNYNNVTLTPVEIRQPTENTKEKKESVNDNLRSDTFKNLLSNIFLINNIINNKNGRNKPQK